MLVKVIKQKQLMLVIPAAFDEANLDEVTHGIDPNEDYGVEEHVLGPNGLLLSCSSIIVIE